jgi:predicted GIY-YIG superfamily endonuclease
MKPFYVYILRCKDQSYYVGHTDDLETRMLEHADGSMPGYTVKRRPVKLVFSCEFTSREEALERELQLKGWSRAKKEALIRDDWDEIQRLAMSRTRPSTSSGRTGEGETPILIGTPPEGSPRISHPTVTF